MKKIYPIGDPEADTGRLAAWWEQELEGANIREKVTVQHSPYDDTSEKEGIFKSLFNALGGIGQLEITNVFHTALPGTPWPLNAWVYTTQKGIITNLIYQTELPKRIEREITFISKGGGFAGIIGLYRKFEGEGVDSLNAKKELRKKLAGSISYYYRRKGTMYMLDQATYTFTPQEDGTLATIMTGPQVVSLLADLVLVGRSRLSFGLGKVIAALQALEVAP